MTNKVPRQITTLLCIWFLAHQPLPTWAGQNASEDLEIVVLQGDGATHMVNYRHFEEPIVQVRRAGRSVKGARVQFKLPEAGPGGSFIRERTHKDRLQKQTTVSTGKKGRARAKGFEPNEELGDWVLKVVATEGGQRAEAELRQTNILSESARQQGRQAWKMGIVWVAVVGATVAGLVAIGATAATQ